MKTKAHSKCAFYLKKVYKMTFLWYNVLVLGGKENMKKYLSTMFLVTAITLTLSGCNDYEDKQREYDYANKMEQEEQLSAIEETNISYTFESDSQEVYESLQNADTKLKEMLEEEHRRSRACGEHR